MIRWSSAESATWLNRRFPGFFDNPLGARVFRAFLPGGRERKPSHFSGVESHERVVDAMIQCGTLFRLAADYDNADRYGLLEALDKRLQDDTRQLAANQAPRPGLDPVYGQLLAWSAQRLARNEDWIRGERFFRGSDFSTSCRDLLLSRSLIQLEGDAIAEGLPRAAAASASPRL